MDNPDLKNTDWQEEEHHVPTLAFVPDFDEAGNFRRMTHQIVDRVVKERFTHAPLVDIPICKEHSFVFVDGGKRQGGKVRVKCQHCPLGHDFIPGVHTLKDGQLETLTYPDK